MNDRNYDVSVFIIDIENNYIALEEYIAYDYNNGMFICLTNDELNSEFGLFNNSICIYKDWQKEIDKAKIELKKYGVEYYKDIYCQWQDVDEVGIIPNNERFRIYIYKDDKNKRDMQLKQYLDGYLSCQNIMSNVPSLLKEGECIQKYIPAIMTAHYTKVRHNGKFYNGYLPAIGQLLYISKNANKVNEASKTFGIEYNFFSVYYNPERISGYWWSSTENYYHDAWGLDNGATIHGNKVFGNLCVLPLFAL